MVDAAGKPEGSLKEEKGDRRGRVGVMRCASSIAIAGFENGRGSHKPRNESSL